MGEDPSSIRKDDPMKKNKKIIALLLTLLFLLIAGIFLFPKIKEGYLGRTVEVYVPKENIPSNTMVTEEMIQTMSMPVEFIDRLKIASKQDIVGYYTKVPVFSTDYFTKEKLADKEEQALYENNNLIAVTLSTLSSSVGAKIAPGDLVSVYGYQEGYEGSEKIIYPDLQKIEVAYLLDSQGRNVTKEEQGASALPSVAVLKVATQQQSMELLKLEYSSKVHLERLAPEAELPKEKEKVEEQPEGEPPQEESKQEHQEGNVE